MSRRRSGFTLIEILVVIGIILLLMAISVLGYGKLDKIASERTTHTRLDTCRAMQTEYEINGTLNPILAIYPTGAQAQNPGDANIGGPGRSATAVANTETIFQIFSRVPNVKTMLAQQPLQALIPGPANNPIMVDAWKNPIIFVPSAGLPGVTVNGQSKTVVSVDGRPFWVSAGQDGRFDIGDDNLYSTPIKYQ